MTGRPVPPRISIIVPAYKSARYLLATLDSIRSQTWTAWECIVVDDGSPDEVAAIAQSYAARDPRFRLLRQQNAGVSAARNAGYACASQSAEFVIFQDSDDTWEPDALALLVAALDAHPEAAGAHGLAERMGPEGEALPDRHAEFMRYRFGFDGRRTVLRPDQPSTLDCLVMKFKMFPPGVVLVRRPLFDRAGLWNEDRSMAASADWELFTRISRYGPFVMVDRVIAGYRKHEANMTANDDQWKHWMRRQAVLRHLVGSHETTPAQARLVRRAARDWGRGIYMDKWGAVWNSFHQGHRRYAWAHLRACAFFFRATLASDLDLRLHRFVSYFKRA